MAAALLAAPGAEPVGGAPIACDEHIRVLDRKKWILKSLTS
jgi:hypothetical protein